MYKSINTYFAQSVYIYNMNPKSERIKYVLHIYIYIYITCINTYIPPIIYIRSTYAFTLHIHLHIKKSTLLHTKDVWDDNVQQQLHTGVKSALGHAILRHRGEQLEYGKAKDVQLVPVRGG